MNRIDEWLRRRAARNAHRPRLEDALLTDRAWGYARYRLQWLVLRVLLRTGLHLLEIILLARLFPLAWLAPVLVYRSSLAVTGSLWWGGLETLREQVRHLTAEQHWARARRHIEAWLGGAVLLGGLAVGAVLVWIEVAPSPFAHFSVFDAYGLACGLRLAMDMVTRTYHSGIYALRRIYRPLWSILVPDILDVAGVLVLWPLLGPWGFALSLFAVGIVRSTLTLFFVRRAYESSRLGRPGIAAPRPHVDGIDVLGSVVRHALANFAANIDAVLVLVLLGAKPDGNAVPLALLFHVLRPLLSAGYSWARLFYFDLKRLQRNTPALLLERFYRFLRRVAIAFATGLATAVIGAALLAWGTLFDWSVSLLLPFFAVRALFSLRHIQAFSHGSHGTLFRLTTVLGLGLAMLAMLDATQLEVLIGATGVLALAIVLGGSPTTASEASIGAKEKILGLPAWLSAAAATRGRAQIGSALVDGELARVGAVASSLVEAIGEGAVCRHGARGILWFRKARDGEPDLSPARLQIAAAGALRSLHIGPSADSGRAALTHALEAGIFSRDLTAALREAAPATPEADLKDSFAKHFPQGTLLEVGSGRIHRPATPLGAVATRAISRALARLCRGTASGDRRLPFDIAAYVPSGVPRLIFVIPWDAGNTTAWRRATMRASLRDSLHAE